MKFRLIGTGFTYDSQGAATGGTIQTAEFLLADGTTLVNQLTDINRSLENFEAAFNAYGPNIGRWLLNGDDVLIGQAGGDDLYGETGNDTLNGGDGDDYIDGGQGTDTYDGGDGVDQLSFQTSYFDPAAFSGINLNAQTGTVIDPFGNSETFVNFEGYRGTLFADVFVGSSVGEVFYGLGGRDSIDGGGGVDTVRYDRDDRQGGTRGVNVDLTTGIAIDGFGSQDTLVSIENVRATNANDVVTGSSGANLIRTFGGNDTLNGLAGADIMRGGAGNDSYYVDNSGDVVDESDDGGNGNDTVISSISFDLANSAVILGQVENLTLTGSGNLSGIGNGLANVINGNTGANSIAGGDGGDKLNGAGGADNLSGGEGADTITGGAGADTISGGTEGDLINGGADGDSISGNDGNDFIYGDDPGSANYSDAISGNAGADSIFGFGGNDTIWGGADGDSLRGGDGGDTLRGEGGNDYLYGEGGADAFQYTARDFDTDQIFDFQNGVDKIQMSQSIFANYAAVMASSQQIGGDVLIDAGSGDRIALKNFSLANLTADDFIFF
ncbi:hypothetical protein Sa4125_15450 [Aureimonas sp. SA4125]|nr:hypothetical protein Sa4125_15450 [Aureimonas sp. SA4125]